MLDGLVLIEEERKRRNSMRKVGSYLRAVDGLCERKDLCCCRVKNGQEVKSMCAERWKLNGRCVRIAREGEDGTATNLASSANG